MIKKIVLLLPIALFIFACGSSKETADNTKTVVSKSTVEENKVSTNTQEDKVEKEEIDLSKINWLDFETAIEKNKTHNKFIFIDIYTDWCGWCKKMDATTFTNAEIIKYMNTHFYAVKMNAESKDPIPYKGKLYEWKNYGRGGYNTLAISLLGSQMSFPSFVVLSKRETKLGKIIGYRDASGMMTELKKYGGK